MSELFFTSDLHFGHEKIIQYCNRPFSTVEEMDEALIANWNLKVPADGKVWLLGDIFFCSASRASEILSRLNGKKHLVFGNHDRMIRNQFPIQKLFEKIYPDLHEDKIDNIPVVMCHYPMLSWNRAFYGSFMLHGHVHSSEPTNGTNRRYDVGVDANIYAPVSWADIKLTLEAIKLTKD
jgi:calcineurin-like phosphoesterase family protein